MSPSAFVAKNVVSASKFPTLDVDVEGVDEREPRVPSVFRDGGKENSVQVLSTSMSEPSPKPGVAVVIVRPAECVGFGKSPVPQLRIADDFGCPTGPKLGVSMCSSAGISW